MVLAQRLSVDALEKKEEQLSLCRDKQAAELQCILGVIILEKRRQELAARKLAEQASKKAEKEKVMTLRRSRPFKPSSWKIAALLERIQDDLENEQAASHKQQE